MILIYTHTITPRVAYVMDLVFGTVLQTPYQLTDDAWEFDSSLLPKLAYTFERPETGVFMESGSLLFEDHLREYRPVKAGEYKEFPILFPVGEASRLPYDLFATVFYVATRYEEYLEHEPDKHGRFYAEQSLEYWHKVLQRPFLQELILDFSDMLKQHFPDLVFGKRTFEFLSTIDIDNAFAYAHKGFTRNAGGLLKDLCAFRFKQAVERIAANLNDKKDPYNTFELIHRISRETGTKLQYFVLIGDYATYDKNPHHTNKGFQKLLKSLSAEYPLGLHPSYQTYDDPGRIAMEKSRLEAITGKTVTSARCHFLRIRFPETYRAFIEAGITDDYTMIHASQSGFRTGLCVPFNWFDLKKNEATALRIHTSEVMEGTLRDYNKMQANQALELSLKLMDQVKKYGGEFISIYHNDSFVTSQAAWIELYKTLLKESRK